MPTLHVASAHRFFKYILDIAVEKMTGRELHYKVQLPASE